MQANFHPPCMSLNNYSLFPYTSNYMYIVSESSKVSFLLSKEYSLYSHTSRWCTCLYSFRFLAVTVKLFVHLYANRSLEAFGPGLFQIWPLEKNCSQIMGTLTLGPGTNCMLSLPPSCQHCMCPCRSLTHTVCHVFITHSYSPAVFHAGNPTK